MKKVFSQIISLVMAVLVLASTVSWTVDKHLCMGRVMDISFFAHAEDCGMESAIATLDSEDYQNPCCEDESFTIEGQDHLKLTWSDLDLDHQVFLVAFAQSYIDLFVPLEKLPVPNEKYPPPILIRDIHVLDQVFLI
ncbi:hypothetical protein LCL86_08470 [Muricauda ruestringensis]|jgi:hypothetical protein|uniref:Secreted protein n=1 Tax=Flagellimonas marinaquae TaxID=254955 RepID=A0AA48HPG8_9FLAO|nr:hypothetical protein [Allomuricauda ruestringensis]MCA0959072.1 hypothetical protein [Allomuricauda ruestringensis]BDW91961.1 hypothetical protein MACH07_07930 [Allomuricauda aquimarina]